MRDGLVPFGDSREVLIGPSSRLRLLAVCWAALQSSSFYSCACVSRESAFSEMFFLFFFRIFPYLSATSSAERKLPILSAASEILHFQAALLVSTIARLLLCSSRAGGCSADSELSSFRSRLTRIGLEDVKFEQTHDGIPISPRCSRPKFPVSHQAHSRIAQISSFSGGEKERASSSHDITMKGWIEVMNCTHEEWHQLPKFPEISGNFARLSCTSKKYFLQI